MRYFVPLLHTYTSERIVISADSFPYLLLTHCPITYKSQYAWPTITGATWSRRSFTRLSLTCSLSLTLRWPRQWTNALKGKKRQNTSGDYDIQQSLSDHRACAGTFPQGRQELLWTGAHCWVIEFPRMHLSTCIFGPGGPAICARIPDGWLPGPARPASLARYADSMFIRSTICHAQNVG